MGKLYVKHRFCLYKLWADTARGCIYGVLSGADLAPVSLGANIYKKKPLLVEIYSWVIVKL